MTKYQPPVDVDFGAPLPQRTSAPAPGEELHVIQLAGYELLAGIHDGRPFVRAPGATRVEALAMLQRVVNALEAL